MAWRGSRSQHELRAADSDVQGVRSLDFDTFPVKRWRSEPQGAHKAHREPSPARGNNSMSTIQTAQEGPEDGN
jgi:hypothetical protein